jgi:hypothetical protein
MKNIFLTAILLFCFGASEAQETTSKWNYSAEVNFTTIPTENFNGTDTVYQNTLSIAPSVSIRSKGGFGVIYMPWFLTGGTHPGIFLNQVTIGLEQYDKKKFNLVADYSHYFFSGNNSVTPSPITNEILFDATYKRSWVRPRIAAGLGFGINKAVAPSQFAYDIELATGVSHSIDWTGNCDFTFNITPSVFVNGGTSEYFSFLKLSKYISHSSNIQTLVKNPHATSKGRGRGNSTGTSGTGSTASQQTLGKEQFTISNLEINIESTIEHGSFSLRPSGSIYVPFGAVHTLEGYWELTFSYYF